VAGIIAIRKKEEAEPLCTTPDLCSDPGADLIDEAQRAGNVATGLVVSGGVLVAVGASLWIADAVISGQHGQAPSRPRRMRLMASPLAGGGMMALEWDVLSLLDP
jgi:hypothetical protein